MNIKYIIPNQPFILLGDTFNIKYKFKKYHSGHICKGADNNSITSILL